MRNDICPICGGNALFDEHANFTDTSKFAALCDVCGSYHIDVSLCCDNRLAPFLFYNRPLLGGKKCCFVYFPGTMCEKLNAETQCYGYSYPHYIHLDEASLANWYPKTFAERIDAILKRVYELAGHIGSWVPLTEQELMSLFFVDRNEISNGSGLPSKRSHDACRSDAAYMSMVLQKRNLVEVIPPSNGEERKIRLLPEGYARVDELQKDDLGGKRVFVAMKFGDETVALRKAIEKGVAAAGYLSLPIDETEHNEFIPLEILKQIRDSRFVVVDLSDDNRGAYFEAGYAMGIGKPVIQLCKRSKAEDLHFDLRQKNTILWENENDIPEPLKKRILATIE